MDQSSLHFSNLAKPADRSGSSPRSTTLADTDPGSSAHSAMTSAGPSIARALSHHQRACEAAASSPGPDPDSGDARESTPPPDKHRYLPLSRTTDRVLRILLSGDLSRVRAESVAESLGMSCTTLRRRLRADHTSYQFLLDRARQYRCEQRLRERWLPGKCLADELGYLEVNSFYRAFRRWTGLSYSEYKLHYC